MNGSSPTIVEAPTPFTFGFTLSGNLDDFTAQATGGVTATGPAATNQVQMQAASMGGAGNDAAYMSYDGSTIYLGVGSKTQTAGTWNPATPGTFITIYLGNGTGEGSLLGPSGVSPTPIPTLPVASTDVIIWNSSTPTVATAQTWTGSMWGPAAYTPAVGYASGAEVEFSVTLADIGNPASVTMVGAVLTNVGGPGGASVYETFPTANSTDITPASFWTIASGNQNYVDASLKSCLGPAQQLHLF